MFPDALASLFARMREWKTPVSFADTTIQDAPLVFVNRAFEEVTGYVSDYVVGRNCRFLQGPGTDRAAAGRVRVAVDGNRPVAECLLNYRRDGSEFNNLLLIEPVGRLGHSNLVLGVQYPFDLSTTASDIDAHRDKVGELVSYLAEVIGYAGQKRQDFTRLQDTVAHALEDAYFERQTPSKLR